MRIDLLEELVLNGKMTDAERQNALKTVERARKLNTSTIAIAGLTVLLATAGITLSFPVSLILPALAWKNSHDLESILSDFGMADATESGGIGMNFRWKMDPSGYVYNTITGKRISGVKVTAYFKESENAEPILWDATEWDQINPLYTDDEGRYAWDVPEGLWQVRCEKEGYEPAESEWLPVPPPQTEVNIAMMPLEMPETKVVTRLYGKGRYETSFLMADQLKEAMGVDKFESIVIACGTDFADALAGSYLAAEKNAPILLVGKSEKRINTVTDYVKKNLSANGTVYILGGTAAIPEDMDKALSGIKVERLAGAERYETNTLILKAGGVKDGDEIFVCTGKAYADSLSVSSVGKPILLVKSKLTTAQINLLKSLKNLKFTIIGGDSAVSQDIENALKPYGTIKERLSGKNRFDTSVQVAEKYFDQPDTVTLVYSHDFPDGLSAGPYAYYKKSPTVLARTKTTGDAKAYVETLENLKTGYVIGGEGLISDEAIMTIFGVEDASKIISIYRE